MLNFKKTNNIFTIDFHSTSRGKNKYHLKLYLVGSSLLKIFILLSLDYGINLSRNIVPYIRKFGKHPVTGAPLKQEDLIPLVFHKNSEGKLLPLLLIINLNGFVLIIEELSFDIVYWKLKLLLYFIH